MWLHVATGFSPGADTRIGLLKMHVFRLQMSQPPQDPLQEPQPSTQLYTDYDLMGLQARVDCCCVTQIRLYKEAPRQRRVVGPLSKSCDVGICRHEREGAVGMQITQITSKLFPFSVCLKIRVTESALPEVPLDWVSLETGSSETC